MPSSLFEQAPEDPHQRPLLAFGQAPERGRRSGHALEQQGADPGTGRGQHQDLHPAIAVRGPAADQAPGLEPVHEAGDVRGVAGERLRELAHRDGLVRLDQVQHVALRGRELELRGQRREVRALGEEEPHEQFPGIAGGRALALHRHTVHFRASIFDNLKYSAYLLSMTLLKLVPLDDIVVFPGMTVTVPTDVGGDARVLLLPRSGSGYAKVGVVAEVTER